MGYKVKLNHLVTKSTSSKHYKKQPVPSAQCFWKQVAHNISETIQPDQPFKTFPAKHIAPIVWTQYHRWRNYIIGLKVSGNNGPDRDITSWLFSQIKYAFVLLGIYFKYLYCRHSIIMVKYMGLSSDVKWRTQCDQFLWVDRKRK